MEYRKLKKTELIQLIRVLNDLKLRSYLTDLLKKDADLMNMFKPNNEESTSNENETNEDIDKKGIMFSIIIDISGYLLENLEKCDENLNKLIKSFLDFETLEDVEEMDADLFVDVTKHLIQNEVPKVINKIVNLDNFKKKMNQEMSKTVQ